MSLEPHARIHFHDQFVEFVLRHKVADKTFEEGNAVAAGQIKLKASKRLVRPVPHVDRTDSQRWPAFLDQLPERLEAIEGASVIASGDDDRSFIDPQQVSLWCGPPGGYVHILPGAIFPYQGILN